MTLIEKGFNVEFNLTGLYEKTEIHLNNIYKLNYYLTRNTPRSITKISRFMVLRETVAVCSENDMKLIHTEQVGLAVTPST
jgi:hypothetical protein